MRRDTRHSIRFDDTRRDRSRRTTTRKAHGCSVAVLANWREQNFSQDCVRSARGDLKWPLPSQEKGHRNAIKMRIRKATPSR